VSLPSEFREEEIAAMMIGDLSTLADQLRKEGFEARNLGQIGITIWRDGAQTESKSPYTTPRSAPAL
jgi:hypothetical protein